jgi:uncharacterized protein YukE
MSQTLDVLGETMVLPDPDSVDTIATEFQAVRDVVGDANNELQGVKGGAQDLGWEGSAAEAFRNALGPLPGYLDKAWASYNGVYGALTSYADSLRSWAATFRSVAGQANDVLQEARQTQSAIDQASAQGLDRSALSAKLSQLEGELGRLQNQLGNLWWSDLAGLAGTCVNAIDNAQNEGIRNPGWLGEIASWGGAALGDVGSLAYNMVIKPLASLPGDLAYLATHLTDPAAWSHVLGDLSGLLALACLIPGVGEVLLPVMIGVTVAKLGVDAIGAAEGEQGMSWTNVGMDAVSLAMLGHGALGGDAGDAGLADDLPTPSAGQTVYRVWGETEDDSGALTGEGASPWGHSWTTTDPSTMDDMRAELGLPPQNPARFVTVGVLRDPDAVTTVRNALQVGANPGGAPEYLIDNPESAIQVTGVYGLNP